MPEFDYQTLLSGIHNRPVEFVHQVTKPDAPDPSRDNPLLLIPGNRVSFEFDADNQAEHPIIGSLMDSYGPHQGEIAVFHSGTTGDVGLAIVRNSTKLLYGLREPNVRSVDLSGLELGNRSHSEATALLKPRTSVLEKYSAFDLKRFVTSVLTTPRV